MCRGYKYREMVKSIRDMSTAFEVVVESLILLLIDVEHNASLITIQLQVVIKVFVTIFQHFITIEHTSPNMCTLCLMNKFIGDLLMTSALLLNII